MLSLGLKMRIGGFTALIASVLTTGLKAWHKFTASAWTGSNRLPDSSGNSNTAALFTGRGLSFDGVNDVVTIGATGVTVKSVVFYAYPDTTTQVIMQLQSLGVVGVSVVAGTLTATGFTSPTLYVNGAASSTVAATTWQQIAITSATGVSASNVLFGQSNATFYSGDLSNVKFFSVELSAAQVAELYANPEQALPSGVSSAELVGWWTMQSIGGVVINGQTGKVGGVVSGATSINSLPQITQFALKGINNYMTFDGTNDYVTIPTVSTAANFTLHFLCVPYSAHGGLMFGSSTGTQKLGFLAGNVLFLRIVNGGAFDQTVTYKAGDIYSIFITRDSGNIVKLYKNGVVSTLFAGAPYSGTLTFDIFGQAASAQYLNGTIFRAAAWSTDLTVSAITELESNINIDLAQNTGNYTFSSNLLGYWNNTGNANSDWLDLSGNSKNGTVSGSPTTIKLPEGASGDILGKPIRTPNTGQLILDGDGYASIADAATLDITSAVTLEAWIKPFQVSAAQTIIGKNSAYALNITSGAKLQFQRWSSAASGTVSSSASLAVDTWKHVCAVYNGTTTVLYINGAQDTSSGSVTGAIDATSTDVLMGALTTSTQLFSGYLDSVKVYDAALTAAQVLTNYNAEKSEYGL